MKLINISNLPCRVFRTQYISAKMSSFILLHNRKHLPFKFSKIKKKNTQIKNENLVTHEIIFKANALIYEKNRIATVMLLHTLE